MKRSLVMILVGLMLAVAVTPAAHAAKKEDKAARRMAQMKKQFEAEKAQLQAQFEQDKAALEDKAKASEKESSEIKGSLTAAKRRQATLAAELETLRKEKTELEARQQATETSLREAQATLDKTSKTLTDLTAQHQATVRDLKANEAQRKELNKSLVQRDQSLVTCNEKNAKLHDFGLQLVKVYDKPGTYEAVLRTEPFTQIKRVELENILQDYRDKLDEQRVGVAGR